MIILGIDPASATGLAEWNLDRHESSILTTTIKSTVKKDMPAKAGELGAAIGRYLDGRPEMPEFAVIERPLPSPVTNINTTVLLTAIFGAICGQLTARGIKFEDIADSSWRSQIYGFGRRKGWSTPEWKKHAKAQCEMMRIDIANGDEAEAAMLAFYGGRVSKFRKKISHDAEQAGHAQGLKMMARAS